MTTSLNGLVRLYIKTANSDAKLHYASQTGHKYGDENVTVQRFLLLFSSEIDKGNNLTNVFATLASPDEYNNCTAGKYSRPVSVCPLFPPSQQTP